MNWIELTSKEQVDGILSSTDNISLIFKHSTSCSTSAVTLDRLQRKWGEEDMKEMDSYFLDLLRFRDVSNYVAEKTGVFHESPQAIVIKNGEVIYEASHFFISYDEIKDLLSPTPA